ncbi:hypothetical protein SD427_18985 (plasmid) [Chryseobacterium sp. JJR-5R]|uniref:AbiU2 domain-containing protein n=1 Tax=Chryseobacterium sp. JJR-5R TaxID=3093923 RepID=UPI002A75C0EE|nr:hypothetical protein [Chryseobacterium sp. JJR-5R]WPO84615.1 hypothetical protein SD427_18985 [Chryseobacterium sp. JJR-5R]
MVEKNLLEELDIISKIILDAKSSFDVVLTLNNENHKKVALINHEKISSDFFRFVEANFFRITIIELFKLFSYNTNDYYSFYSLRNRFSPGQSYETVKMSKDTMKNLKLLLKQSTETITKLSHIRNKVYAHKDKDFKNYIGIIDIQEINSLISISKSIFNIFYQEAFEKEYYFDYPLATPLDSLEHLLEKIEFYNVNYETVMMQKYDKRNFGSS